MLIDVFVSAPLRQDFDTLYKARILVAIILTYSLIFFIAIFWLSLAPNILPIGRVFGLGICAAALFSFLFCILLLYFKSAFTLAANITIASTAISIFSGILLSGGPLDAPATVMLLLPLMMAFILLNKNSGMIWTLLIMTCHIVSILAHIAGYRFPQLLAEDMLGIQHLAHWLMAYAAIVVLMFIFDIINHQLRSEVETERQRYVYLANHDTLTHLSNRLSFEENFNKAIQRSNRTNKPFALLTVDLDNFKPINDTLGHDAGDIALCEIAKRLKDSLRGIDTVARIGGDEFAILVEGLNNEAPIARIADKIRSQLSHPITQLHGAPCVGASIGIAIFPTHSDNKENLLKLADNAMYCAKRQKNNWCICSASEI